MGGQLSMDSRLCGNDVLGSRENIRDSGAPAREDGGNAAAIF
jgi:hypothetical protein